ncbi:amidohydrolase family protein [Pedobacter nototheniae]|uniref:amidohydrolase family protein n=1 Tax=Pedobacter nototheniae TaxID=2488994 RepID=UPI00103C73B2|nr:amidohydrolase family protein [Pedobacter nototheniae]
MLKYFSADWVFPVNQPPIKNGVVVVTADGEIKEVLTEDEAVNLDLQGITKLKGALIPGFINTHCHLELSNMLGLIPERTGLVEFVQSIIKNRQADTDLIVTAMERADEQMFENGIVAVGDISNQPISKSIKQNSKIYYYTFIEAMGFNPERAEAIMDYAKGVKAQFAPLPCSIVPHAPYSVSEKLFQLIDDYAQDSFLSIHNQETAEENTFFETKTGGFLKLYEFLNLNIDFFQPSGKTSLQTWLPHLNQKTLLVHNTFTNKTDLEFAQQNKADLYWCLCPQANLYIENKLPNVDLLMDESVKITLGTDSLASNHQLNILAEMKILQIEKHIGFNDLLKWATINGAEFLELDKQLGTLEPGKRPGINLINLSDDFIIENDNVQRII